MFRYNRLWALSSESPRRLVLSLTFAVVVLSALAATTTALSSTPGPNGRIVYNQELAGLEHLFTIQRDGTLRRRLTRSADFGAQNADWSPDGRSIVFERYPADESRAAVAVMNADGSGIRELTPTGFQGNPSFTPDGRSIVFFRTVTPTNDGIWSMGVDGLPTCDSSLGIRSGRTA